MKTKIMTALLLALVLHTALAGYTTRHASITASEARPQANSFWVREGYGYDAPVYSVSDQNWDAWEMPDTGTYSIVQSYADHEFTWTLQAPYSSHTYTIHSETTCDKILWQPPDFC